MTPRCPRVACVSLYTRAKTPWRHLIAALLSGAYLVLYLFAAFCLATGYFHHPFTALSHDHHEHAHQHTRDSPPSDAPQTFDICAFAQQVLQTTVIQASIVSRSILLPVVTFCVVITVVGSFEALSRSTCRAPPFS